MTIKRSSWSIPYLIFLLIFVVLPLVLIAIYAFQDGEGGFTFENIARFFTDQDSLSTFASFKMEFFRLARSMTITLL